MPTCSPAAPTRRTSGTRILSLMRGSTLMKSSCCRRTVTSGATPAPGVRRRQKHPRWEVQANERPRGTNTRGPKRPVSDRRRTVAPPTAKAGEPGPGRQGLLGWESGSTYSLVPRREQCSPADSEAWSHQAVYTARVAVAPVVRRRPSRRGSPKSAGHAGEIGLPATTSGYLTHGGRAEDQPAGGRGPGPPRLAAFSRSICSSRPSWRGGAAARRRRAFSAASGDTTGGVGA